jgi:hypothetical protein
MFPQRPVFLNALKTLPFRRCARNSHGSIAARAPARTPWGTSDFYIEDPEGYIIAFGESDGSN